MGPWLAAWAEERFAAQPAVRIIDRQQWTPDLANDIATVESVVFIDCAVDIEPGAIRIAPVHPLPAQAGLATHHTGAAELLAMSEELFASRPHNALLLTIGAGSTEMGETFSTSVNDALPDACRMLEATVMRLLATCSD